MEQLEKFVVEFFKSLKCNISRDGEILVVENIPKSFEDLLGRAGPYRLSFVQGNDAIFVGKGSSLVVAMTKFLEGAGKTTLLKIDFEIDPEVEIFKRLNLKNCEIGDLIKRHTNNFFSRFTFMTTFRYLNKSEQVVNEIYVHDGKVIDGDLSGYTILEGSEKDVSTSNVKEEYEVARKALKRMLGEKTREVGGLLGEKADEEISRIKSHYGHLLGELGGDLSGTLKRVNDVELALRVADESEKESLRIKLERLRVSLIKVGDNEAREKILKEQEFTIKNVMQEYSLNVDNKLVNTTMIYYPVFNFNLFLNGNGGSGRFLEMSYDPLMKSLNNLRCESCGVEIRDLNLCASGHVVCEKCLTSCADCSKVFCKKCMNRSCSVCGKVLCKNCSKTCLGCGKYVCENHIRKDCVSGEDRCISCLRACIRCHGMAQEKYFGEALDGSKVCQKCLGVEKRSKALCKVFEN